MVSENKKNLLLTSLVTLWVILAFWIFNKKQLDVTEAGTLNKSRKFSSEGFDVNLGLLEQSGDREYNGIIDIFSFRGMPEVVPEPFVSPVAIPIEIIEPVELKVEPEVSTAVSNVSLPKKKNETIAALKYLGFVKKPSGVLLFLSVDGKVVFAVVGDIIDGDVYVKGANDNSVILQDVNTHEEVTISING